MNKYHKTPFIIGFYSSYLYDISHRSVGVDVDSQMDAELFLQPEEFVLVHKSEPVVTEEEGHAVTIHVIL